jgi:hypothetical protein
MRRANNDFVGFLKTYLFTEGPILKEEHGATAGRRWQPQRRTCRGARVFDRLT